ncbi:DNA damage-inducible protein D [Candidatus Woesearchaeota archaeon]|jgi:DNA-damage-inducible protein D|nr:DNA damage-inducible protein D [Candidatus Woesearchaeota archaeon]MBT3537851.1 DNA damage-inducible protein D [Candidatus Woesearchaeota archaeon]MBT4697982.1 DNA damage-inducible protein D [Candidatus Woesearchaeota archaeon]MBT7105520.1 DNA damage-inducible protein D [Candidatus Woesearchaeota archaeon]MBT7931710.1 DNA damage-inducible protein D [Candidatus Woesearchaeota archaeon]
MENQTISRLTKHFEDYAYEEDSIEFWFARDLKNLLGYEQWRNFLKVVEKAKESCKTSGNKVLDHFADASKMVKLGSGSEREIKDIMLTRYACYLIAQNGDPRKEDIAFAQSYFAVKTRKQELIEERIALKERFDAREKLAKSETELSKLIYERGVDDNGFARIRSKGDAALFGGKTTLQMKKKLSIPKNRAMADFLPTVTIAAKNFATEITNFNVKKNELQGEQRITGEHVRNNKRVRTVLLEDEIVPEDLPPEEDIKKLERRLNKSDAELALDSKIK